MDRAPPQCSMRPLMKLRVALRSLLGRPALSASVLSAVALAIAINSALFSVLDLLSFESELAEREPPADGSVMRL